MSITVVEDVAKEIAEVVDAAVVTVDVIVDKEVDATQIFGVDLYVITAGG